MKEVEFDSMDDVWKELERLYDNAQRRKKTDKLGETLFLSAGYFVDYERLVNREIQDNIRKYIYCKSSGTPPYKDLDSTPISFIDDFLIIDEETQSISNSVHQELVNKRKKNA